MPCRAQTTLSDNLVIRGNMKDRECFRQEGSTDPSRFFWVHHAFRMRMRLSPLQLFARTECPRHWCQTQQVGCSVKSTPPRFHIPGILSVRCATRLICRGASGSLNSPRKFGKPQECGTSNTIPLRAQPSVLALISITSHPRLDGVTRTPVAQHVSGFLAADRPQSPTEGFLASRRI